MRHGRGNSAKTVKGASAPGILVPTVEGGREQIHRDGAARVRTCHQGVDRTRSTGWLLLWFTPVLTGWPARQQQRMPSRDAAATRPSEYMQPLNAPAPSLSRAPQSAKEEQEVLLEPGTPMALARYPPTWMAAGIQSSTDTLWVEIGAHHSSQWAVKSDLVNYA